MLNYLMSAIQYMFGWAIFPLSERIASAETGLDPMEGMDFVSFCYVCSPSVSFWVRYLSVAFLFFVACALALAVFAANLACVGRED